MGDAVWIKSLHGICTTQFDGGTLSLCWQNTMPCKRCRPCAWKNNTASDPSADETDLMVYEAANCTSGGLRQDEFSNTPEDHATKESESVSLRWSSEQEPEICTIEATCEPAPLRRSSWKKRPAPHCPTCDPEIRKECDGHEQDKCEEPFSRRSKSLRVACVFYNCRVGGRRGTQRGSEPENGYANVNYGQFKIHKKSQNFSFQKLFVEMYKSWIAHCESRNRRRKDLNTNQQDTKSMYNLREKILVKNE